MVIKENQEKADESLIIRYQPTKEWTAGEHDFQNYSGKITFYSLKGEIINSLNMVSGISDKTTSTNSKETCLYSLERVETWCFGSNCVKIYYFTESCSSGGSPSTGDGGAPGDGPSDPSSFPSEPTEDFDQGTGGNNYNPPINPLPEITVQIINELDGKELCAYNRLEWAGVNASNYINLMTQLFIEFGEGNIENADLIITESDLGYRGGKSYLQSDGKFKIVLSRMGNSSSIEIAAVLVHEMAHAFLAKHYNLYNKSFEELYSVYLNDNGIADFIHDIMGDKFINRMAQVLQDYDNTLFPNFDDFKILASAGVYEFNDDQLAEYNLVRNYAKINDERCKNFY